MSVRIVSPERQRKAKRELGRDAAKVVAAVRTTRASLAAVTKLVARTRREVETETDGLSGKAWRPNAGQVEALYHAQKERAA